MKRSLTVTVVIAILAFFLVAQKAESAVVAYGTVYIEWCEIIPGDNPPFPWFPTPPPL